MRVKDLLYRHWLQFIGTVSVVLLTSCGGEEWADADNNQMTEGETIRPLVEHVVSVALDENHETTNEAATRVGYQPSGDGLQLAWEPNETLGVYIRKTDSSIIYAGQMTGTGTAGDRGTRIFSGTVSAKSDGEQYIYLHPAPANETTAGATAQGTIALTSQSGALGSVAHLSRGIPLVWYETSKVATIQGYAVHLTLNFKEDPGAISTITLRTMSGVGVTEIFPSSFDASIMSAGATKNNELTLTVSGTNTARKVGTQWIAEAYLACSSCDVDVFRTKYDVKVEAANGTFYNEFRSFPGQEDATANTGLQMLPNGRCYNLTTPLTKDVATTIINTQYQVNSLLGMWDLYGKVSDPFSLSTPSSADLNGLPTQLTTHILGTEAKRTDFTTRILLNKSTQGTPTFTWDMVTMQCNGSYKQSDVTYNNIEIIGESTEVYVTFISEYAWSQNLIGYYHYPTGEVPNSSNDVLKTIIFPNVSKGDHVPYNKGGSENIANVNPNTEAANVGSASDAPLSEYTTVQLLYNASDGTVTKTFPVGTTIGFFLMRDPKASSSVQDEGTAGDEGSIDHTGYQPRPDNTLLDWNSWRLFTNTAWNGASGNSGWWDMNCWNFFCSADVGTDDSGTIIPGLAIYGAKDDASHNYNYSFSAMLYMVSTSNPQSMQTGNKAYFNISNTGAQIINK